MHIPAVILLFIIFDGAGTPVEQAVVPFATVAECEESAKEVKASVLEVSPSSQVVYFCNSTKVI